MSHNNIKQIPKPQLTSATRLTPMELNSFTCESKHTVLTPELLESMRKQLQAKAEQQAGQ